MTYSLSHRNLALRPKNTSLLQHNFSQNFTAASPSVMLPFLTTPSRIADMSPSRPSPNLPKAPKFKQYFNHLLESKPWLQKGFIQLNHWDSAWAIRANYLSHRPLIASFFKMISRLGDGWLWAMVTIFTGIYLAATQMTAMETFFAIYTCVLTSMVGYTLYKYLKVHTVRPRPYQVHQVIRLGERPLDVFSFPSGHTLQAVIFSITLCHFIPALAWILIPFTLLIAISRLVLGLHYPTDVAMGALLGLILAKVGLMFGKRIFEL